MSPQMHKSALPSQRLPVYLADMLRVINGANLGDGLSYSEEMVPDDTYVLTGEAEAQSLLLEADETGQFLIAADATLGTPGARVFLDCVATFMPLSTRCATSPRHGSTPSSPRAPPRATS